MESLSALKNTIWLKYKVRPLLEMPKMHFGSVMVITRRHDFPFCRKDILDSSAQQLFTLNVGGFSIGIFLPCTGNPDRTV